MFFNYDLFEIGAIAFVVSGIFIYSFYNSAGPINNESLVNTLPNSEISNNFLDAGVQTDVNISVEAATYVNTGVQTSPRMWLESIRNWITEILGTPNHPATVQYVDVGVQTNGPSVWQTVKQWFLEVCSVRSSEFKELAPHGGVENWRNNLDSIQSVSLQNSDSPLTTLAFGSPNSLQSLIVPEDSASQISEVVSESNLDRVYDITDPTMLINILRESGVKMENFLETNQFFLTFNDVILTVDPNLVNFFI
jgi:hypothetical protein